MFNKRQIGDLGENEAVRVISKQGYKVIERNFLCKMGEIDIIARDKEYYVFIEVKLRKSHDFGGGAGAITQKKISNIKKAAQIYLMKNNLYGVPVRFDAVIIYGDATDKNQKFLTEVIKDAF